VAEPSNATDTIPLHAGIVAEIAAGIAASELSLSQVAARACISVGHLKKVLAGTSSLGMDTAERLLAITGRRFLIASEALR
jgi:hypothetical protein